LGAFFSSVKKAPWRCARWGSPPPGPLTTPGWGPCCWGAPSAYPNPPLRAGGEKFSPVQCPSRWGPGAHGEASKALTEPLPLGLLFQSPLWGKGPPPGFISWGVPPPAFWFFARPGIKKTGGPPGKFSLRPKFPQNCLGGCGFFLLGNAIPTNSIGPRPHGILGSHAPPPMVTFKGRFAPPSPPPPGKLEIGSPPPRAKRGPPRGPRPKSPNLPRRGKAKKKKQPLPGCWPPAPPPGKNTTSPGRLGGGAEAALLLPLFFSPGPQMRKKSLASGAVPPTGR